MTTSITADEARRLIMESSNADLWSLGHALDRSGPEVRNGVSTSLVADMLEVGETENWERTMRSVEKPSDLFLPYCTMPKDDGKTYRSWLPEDLADDDETNIRAFAESSRNDLVRARVFEILWDRFGRFPDANAAIEARFTSTRLFDAESDWPGMVRNLGRLTTLILTLNAKNRLETLAVSLDEAADVLASSSRPFSFPVLADMVCNTLLKKKSCRDAFTEVRANRWTGLLNDVACRFETDPHHGHDALMVLQAWHGRWGDEPATKTVRRKVVEQLRDVARSGDPMHAPTFLDQALQAALDFGIADLSEVVRGDLMASIRASIPAFKQYSGTFTVPAEALAEIDKIVAANPRLPGAFRHLSLIPGLLEIDSAAFRTSATQHLKDHALLAFLPAVHYHHDGKITYRTHDPDGNIERHTALLIAGHLTLVEALLRYFLTQVVRRTEPQDLLDAMANWPHLPDHRAQLFAIASERFAKGDWISSAFIIIPLYEAVLRDLLRAVGYSALKAEPGGIQMDETLNSLIRTTAARSILGDGHCDLVEYVMCDPALGWNLRNEIAHGIIRPDALSPTRVLLAWLLVIRLTCFTARPPDSSAQEGEGQT